MIYLHRYFVTGKKYRIILAWLMLVLSMAVILPAHATPTPRLKPETAQISVYLSKKDAMHFRKGMRAADKRRWDNVFTEAKRINDPVAKKILLWRIARSNPNADFDLLTKIIQNQSDWPSMTRIRAKAESKMFERALPPQEAINWFLGAEPVSGEGRAVMAIAYNKLGRTEISDRWLRLAWRESRLTRDRQRKLYRKFKHRLTKEDHIARADHLVWLGRRHYESARGLLSLLSKPDRALINARIKIGANSSGIDKAIRAVPKALLNDTGLLYERAVWRRKRVSESSAIKALLKIDTPPKTLDGKRKLWREKRRIIYWALKEKRYKDAYKLTQYHGLNRGVDFAEAEFMAGWIALVKLNNPSLALKHFSNLKNGVSLPVSLGRAYYWMGRAAEAKGEISANSYYLEASKYPNVFYGQLAAEKLGSGSAFIQLPAEPESDGIKHEFESRELIKALHIIGESGNERIYNIFSFHLDDNLQNKEELSLLSKLAKDYGYIKASVRAAKQAGQFDTMLTETGYPMPEIILALPSEFDIPFVLAIARQESEFHTAARSHANAYGMMQMIHSTAKYTARKARLPYQRSWLIDRPDYATKLGAQHLNDLMDIFDDSYILTAAAYNAGGHRVRQWIKAYGDPRKGEIDPIDWIESIPFSETRNYVQRVMENLQVYRARMDGNTYELHILRDISR